MPSPYEHIRVERLEPGITLITFDRPQTRNALNLEMNLELRSAVEALGVDESVRVVIFTGAGGKAFVSGADIAGLRTREGSVALARYNARLTDAIAALPHPTIAAIRGYALGGGCELALACDLRVAGRSARLGQPEVGLGILPAAGGTFRLPRLVGVARAKELIFTGAILDAEEALAIGLVNRVVSDEAVLEEATTLARAISGQGRLAVRLAKVAIDQGAEASRAASSWLEALGQHALYDSDEKRERMDRFLEAREARRRSRATQTAEAPDPSAPAATGGEEEGT